MNIKRYIRHALCVITCSMSFGWSHAQYVTDYLKAADKYFNKADYYSAAQYYEKYLNNLNKGKESGYDPYAVQSLARKAGLSEERSQQVVYQIAECYKALNYYSKAEPYYSQAVSYNTKQFPLAWYGYGLILRSLERYADAEKAMTTFLDQYTIQDRYSAAAKRELLNLQFIRAQLQQKNKDVYKISKAETPLNMPGANYAPVLLSNGNLVFTSTRPDSTLKKTGHINRLYEASFSNGVLSTIKKFALPESGNHQGAAAFNADGNMLFFSAWELKDDKKSAAIYCSQRNGNSWSKPVLMDNVNVTGSNSQQPFVTPDGKALLFASDRTGGQGGFDLWSASLDEKGNAGEPVNLGTGINTTGDEQAPYYHAASGTLVFASTGRIGMGGYDLYFCKGTIGSSFSNPENFGYPVNSVKDDLYFASNGDRDNLLSSVWISSDRTAECCLELFLLSNQTPPPAVVKAEVPVVDPVKKTELPEPGVMEELKNVYYEYNKSDLLKGSHVPLDRLVELMNEHKDIIIEVGGHTDSKGSDEYNENLSLARAQKCVDYIISKGISKDRIIAKGYGAVNPVAPNTNADGSDNPAGRKLNRITTFTIVK